MSPYEKRIAATPAPAVPEPGSARSRLLSLTASIGRTGIIVRADVAELAESYALEDVDLGRFFEALAAAHTLK
jgi:hypothetical protein